MTNRVRGIIAAGLVAGGGLGVWYSTRPADSPVMRISGVPRVAEVVPLPCDSRWWGRQFDRLPDYPYCDGSPLVVGDWDLSQGVDAADLRAVMACAKTSGPGVPTRSMIVHMSSGGDPLVTGAWSLACTAMDADCDRDVDMDDLGYWQARR